MTEEEYDAFWKELTTAQEAEVHGFEDSGVFEGCMPVEVMARRGRDTLLSLIHIWETVCLRRRGRLWLCAGIGSEPHLGGMTAHQQKDPQGEQNAQHRFPI